eukprot:GEZU01023320.1.p1 GENE.GEZU01023320.1~~GEZU01023320.1.p1  ORF type:complete len:258 (+),score=38.26 GEZU01023320.1:154-927(+)
MSQDFNINEIAYKKIANEVEAYDQSASSSTPAHQPTETTMRQAGKSKDTKSKRGDRKKDNDDASNKSLALPDSREYVKEDFMINIDHEKMIVRLPIYVMHSANWSKPGKPVGNGSVPKPTTNPKDHAIAILYYVDGDGINICQAVHVPQNAIDWAKENGIGAHNGMYLSTNRLGEYIAKSCPNGFSRFFVYYKPNEEDYRITPNPAGPGGERQLPPEGWYPLGCFRKGWQQKAADKQRYQALSGSDLENAKLLPQRF